MPVSPHYKNQEETILAHLHSYDNEGKRRTISAMEALGLYRICSLSARMSALQKRYGYQITKQRKVDNTGKRYVRYGLATTQRR